MNLDGSNILDNALIFQRPTSVQTILNMHLTQRVLCNDRSDSQAWLAGAVMQGQCARNNDHVLLELVPKMHNSWLNGGANNPHHRRTTDISHGEAVKGAHCVAIARGTGAFRGGGADWMLAQVLDPKSIFGLNPPTILCALSACAFYSLNRL